MFSFKLVRIYDVLCRHKAEIGCELIEEEKKTNLLLSKIVVNGFKQAIQLLLDKKKLHIDCFHSLCAKIQNNVFSGIVN